MNLKYNQIESVRELFSFNCDAIISLTTFVVGGCKSGNVYNVFFETGKGRYCYQTLDYVDYVSAQEFVCKWSSNRIKLIISAINENGGIIIGDYRFSKSGVFVNGDNFRWEDSFLIFDGVQTIIKSNSSGALFSIDNTQDFFGYLTVCFFSHSPTPDIKDAKARWMGRDLIAEQNEKIRIESALRVQALERDYLELKFKEMLINVKSEFGIIDPSNLFLTHQDRTVHKQLWGWDELSNDGLETGGGYSFSNDLNQEEDSSGCDGIFDSFGIDYIYHITHYSNLQGILRNGLLSHNNDFVEAHIDNASVNEIRAKKEPIYNKSIHSYVPFYFNPKNPMLYVNKSRQNDVLILAFDRKLLTKKGIVFTDGNAAKSQTRFFSDLRDLDKLNWECLHSNFWTDFENGKSQRMAEVLVWRSVDINALKKIYCFDYDTLDYVLSKGADLDVELNKKFYF